MIFFLRSSKHFNKSLTTIFITINIAINWVISFMSSARVLDFIRDIYLNSETLDIYLDSLHV